MTLRITLLVVVALACTACSRETPPVDTANTAVDDSSSIYAAALAVESRLEGDYGRDAGRKPDQVLEFFGVGRGDVVLDLFSGGGYYSEILSHVVGGDGKVFAHSNNAYLNFVGDEFNRRHATGRLANVEVVMAENNELELEEDSIDVVFLALAYHDVYWADPSRGWPKIDVAKLLAELHKGLKTGGIVGIVDHHAETGAARETGGTLHRIDPSVVIADFEAAGFKFVDKSDLLRNMTDDYSKNVFDDAVRGKTDRFVLKFRK